MERGLKGFLRSYKDRIALIIAIVLSLLLMAADGKQPVRSLRQWCAGFIGYVQEGFSWGPRMLSVQKQNKRLMKMVGEFALQRDRYHEVLQENRNLRRIIGFQEQSNFDFIPAEVIGMGSVGVPGSVHLNVGWEDGCRKNMVLVSDRGVIGKLISINRHTSVGQLMIDPNFRISAKVQRSRVLGIIRWLYGNVCVMEGVSMRSDIKPGDKIVTSGYGKFYPPGLSIGKVFEVSSESSGLFLKIYLRTDVDFSTLEEILIIKGGTSS